MEDLNVKRVNLYELAADKLESMILNEGFQEGDRFPSEQVLTERLNISRNVLRESLRTLQERGLISLRMGDGAYVAHPHASKMADAMQRVILTKNISSGEVYQVRRILECEAARLAAVKGTEDDFDGLDGIVKAMEEETGSVSARIDREIQFHNTLAALSGNSLLAYFTRAMNHLIIPRLEKSVPQPGAREEAVKDHRNIVLKLRQRDPEKCAQAVSAHLDKSYKRWECADNEKYEGQKL